MSELECTSHAIDIILNSGKCVNQKHSTIMSEIQKTMEIRELVDNTPLRNKLVEVRNWEKTMKQKEKDLKKGIVSEVRIRNALLFICLCC